jgi:predicted nucleotidyltransferase
LGAPKRLVSGGRLITVAADITDILNHVDLEDRIPGNIIFRGLGGSHSYGVATPESDFDLKFVYVQRTWDMLGLHTPSRDTHDGKIELDGAEYDFVAYEAGKFARLLLKGNPNIIEFLYFPEDLYEAGDHWLKLVSHRRDFLSQEAVKQYTGYAAGQMKRLENQLKGEKKGASLHTTGGEYNTKWAYHMVRLMWEVDLIATGREPQVRWTGPFEQKLRDVRAGGWTPEEILKWTRQKLDVIDAADVSVLPEKGNAEVLDKWLRMTRARCGGDPMRGH